ncbi:hypothetical protein ONE63_007174 [Megalurothrips usitatus]|uniref:Uncharacterized protein n=1 Tax=Megalurothrips usitatus TaxID=439358 RepID=A0AAV7XV99_9NEOP|nr:hypothetical protein ONE63_007174 [Megalurothrips usitatus]
MAIARNEPGESDYVNLQVEGERFVIAPSPEDEVRVASSIFWQPSNFAKEARNNPMSSSDELDNSDSLGQSHCVAWQSKYSLSSEGDKTDESIQSFHSLGNESVNSRHWRDEDEDQDRDLADSSPYAHVICTGVGSTSSISIETTGTGLKLSASLERLAKQIKFPDGDDDVEEDEEEEELVPPIAPPREYEAPVYENIDVQAKSDGEGQADEGLPAAADKAAAQDGEDMLRALRDKLLRTSCGVAARTPAPRAVCENESSEKDKERVHLEGIVDVKQKIALWNNTGVDSERQDKFDGEVHSRPRRVRPFRGGLGGVVKSASESRVSALVSRHGRGHGPRGLGAAPAASDSRSGSEEFLDVSSVSVGSPGSEPGLAAVRQLNPEGDNLDASDSGLSNKSDDVLGSSGSIQDARRRRASLMRSRRVSTGRTVRPYCFSARRGLRTGQVRPTRPDDAHCTSHSQASSPVLDIFFFFH